MASDVRTSFRGELLRLAREARQATQSELARQTGLTQSLISMIEDGIRPPTEDQIASLSDALAFPQSFLMQQDPILGTGIGEIFHRSRKSLSAKQTSYIHAWMNIVTFSIRRMTKVIEWPDVNLQPWSLGLSVESAELAAEALRALWYVPPGPVGSVTRLLDAAGCLILPTNFETPLMDAVGQWTADLPPLIFVNRDVLQDRLRFNLMHEVGHLVLHQRSSLTSISDEIETEAHRFAAAFLMPERDIRPQLKHLTLDRLAQLKRHWRVSMSALLMRANHLNCITAPDEKALWAQISRNGWRKREPSELDVVGESPGDRYAELINVYRDYLRYSVDDLANLTNLSRIDLIERILPTQPGLRRVV